MNLADFSAEALARAFRRREASPVDAATAVFTRLDQWQPKINAFCFEDRERTLAEARASEARWQAGAPLSPLDGVGPDDLNIRGLIDRVMKGGVKEIIIAVNATVEGQTTAHYITDHLTGLDVKITRLAHGVPVGGELDYLDEGTLSAALRARTAI